MLPVRDTVPSRTYPVVNNLLIASSVLVYIAQNLHPDTEQLFYLYGLVPARFSHPGAAEYFGLSANIKTLFTYMFLHGGFLHAAANLWSLWIFGDNVEDKMGHLRYLVFYLACGISAGFIHMAFNWQSNVPTIGASGAIAGVMGAYLLLFPRAKVLTVIPVIIIPYFIELPAFVFLGVWFLFQFLNAAGTSGAGAGVAWWAHVGGFLAGMLFLQFAIRTPRLGLDEKLGRATARGSTPKIQVPRPLDFGNQYDLHGELALTPGEAVRGARKLVSAPRGVRKGLFTVVVPPGVSDGARLRLRELGLRRPDGGAGDLYLHVRVRNPGEAWLESFGR
jgi:membrane associated rhomboid family serine protease